MKRIRVEFATCQIIGAELVEHVKHRLAKHGHGAHASPHEILGVITEEYQELVEAVRDDDNPQRFVDELFDIGVACIFGVASMNELSDPANKEDSSEKNSISVMIYE